jgi:hypothetical protein
MGDVAMTLPHQTALARDGTRPNSAAAAEAHARDHTGWSGRIEWNRGNIARLVGMLAVGAAALFGLTMCAIGASTTDPSTPRGAANAYFAALQRGDDAAVSELECANPFNAAGRDVVAEALRSDGGSARPYFLGPEYGDSYYHWFDFVVVGRARGSISVKQVRDEDRYLVCDFFDVQYRRP